MTAVERHVIAVEGIVQGVGFRPFVYREATARALRGFVRNDPAGVLIDVEGSPAALEDFLCALTQSPPPLARVLDVHRRSAPPCAYREFIIAPSDGPVDPAVPVAADVATCEACLAELFDPADRRYRYPFINCTHCGPRYTIVEGVPYDRPRTTMAGFEMCRDCRAEYQNPRDRRFHAQPIACAACGPRLRFRAPAARDVTGHDAVCAAAAVLATGGIVAVKGLGGYHLACDASNGSAVAALRKRKHREAKPLAVMAADLDGARRLGDVDSIAAGLLRSPARPIVLLPRRADAPIAAEVAPGVNSIGVMLPYTPLHHLLLREAGRPLVLTSGNRADEPIATDDADAHTRLADIADGFLLHDRPIASRADDSVIRVVAGGPTPLRRSRGHAPAAIYLSRATAAPVLGAGGHLKNTFCLVRGRQALLSPHIGDLDHPDACAAWRGSLAHYVRIFGVEPAMVAHDLHPDYAATRLAQALPAERRIAVQHHHAHHASLLAEHGVDGPMIGVAFDGTGLGADGTIWGGEFLVGDVRGVERMAHLAPVPLPGGDAAARRPDRMAVAHLRAAFGPDVPAIPALATLPGAERRLLESMLERGVHSPLTTSVGRLFDAVAAIAGLRAESRFEGEAAMALEAVADPAAPDRYGFHVLDGDIAVLDPTPVIRAVAEDAVAGLAPALIAGAFHRALAEAVVLVAERLRERTGIALAGLTGGVFQNALLTGLVADGLRTAGFEVLLHRAVPCNDGGLSLGQAWVAVALVDPARN